MRIKRRQPNPSRRLLPWALPVLLLVGLPAGAQVTCDWTQNATAWSNFSSPGYTTSYTYLGEPIADDHEVGGHPDPSAGSAAVSPTDADIASCSTDGSPGACVSAIFGYYNGGTAYDPSDPTTLEDDYIFFRLRIVGDPSFKGAFGSRHWNILLDVDGDGYKEFWVDLEGDYTQTQGDPDRLNVLYDDNNNQGISSPDSARVACYSAYASDTEATSHTRVVSTTSSEYYIDIQVPVTAFVDGAGNQVLFPNSPVSFFYSTSASNSDPLQKDYMMCGNADCDAVALADPLLFGDIIIPNGEPLIEFTNQDLDLVSYYNVGDNVYVWVTDRLANDSSSTAETITVTVTNPETGDDEEITLVETGVDTGHFTNDGCASDSSDCLTTSTTSGSDDDGDLQVAAGDEIIVAYTNENSLTVNDPATILGDCGAIVEFTRSTGLPLDEGEGYELGSDQLFITVTWPDANDASGGGLDPNDPDVLPDPPDNDFEVTLCRSDGGSPPACATGGDLETLTLTETGDSTGVFRNTTGLDATTDAITTSDGTWQGVDNEEVLATFDYECPSGTSLASTDAAKVFFTDKGGRVYFTNGAGTQDVEVYTASQPVFIKVEDGNACDCTPNVCGTHGSVNTITVTVTSPSTASDSETITLYETASGSGVFMNRENDLVTTASSAVVTSASSTWVTDGISAGDTFVIATGPDVGIYEVDSVDSQTQITLTTALSTNRTGIGFSVEPLMTATYDGSVSSNDGVLEANDDDTLTVTYSDCDDGDSSSANDSKTDTAGYNAPDLVINKVLFFPDTTTGSCDTEYVEIYNNTGGNVTLTGYQITDEDASDFDYTVPTLDGSNIVLAAGERAIISLTDDFEDFYDSDNGIYYLFDDSFTQTGASQAFGDPDTTQYPSAEDRADQLTLYTSTGAAVDFVAWSDTSSPSLDFRSDDAAAVLATIWPDDAFRSTSGEISAGESMARTADGHDTDSVTDWDFGSQSVCENILTRAVVGSFEVFGSGQGAVVQWRTVTEDGTMGFDLLRRHEGSGRWVRLNDELLPALIGSPQGSVYRWFDSEAWFTQRLHYQLLETRADGSRQLLDSYAVEVQQANDDDPGSPPETFAAEANPVAAAQQARLQKHRQRHLAEKRLKTAATGHAAKIAVRHDGLHRLEAGQIAAALDLPVKAVQGKIRGGALQLSLGGEPVAWRASDDASAILFYGQATTSAFSRDNIYRVQLGSGETMAVVTGSGPGPAPSGLSFIDTVHFEQDRRPLLLTDDPSIDFWYWDFVVAGHASLGSKDFDLELNGVSTETGTAVLRAELRGYAPAGSVDRFHAVLRLNGTEVGELFWEARQWLQLEAELDQQLLREGNNTVTVEALRDPGAGSHYVLVASFDLVYSRLYRAADERLVCRGDGHPVVSVAGFASPNIELYEITEPLAPVRVTAANIDLGSDGYRISWVPSAPAAVYMAAAAETVQDPVMAWADRPSDLLSHANAADYLVIAPDELAAAAQGLAQYREDASDLRSLVVLLEDIYDEFNHGAESPLAIRDFLAHAHSAWRRPPRYVVLAGAGTYDYRDIMGLGGNLVPPLLQPTANGLFAADHLFADVVGSDGLPDLAVGRIPVLLASELEAYVAKLAVTEAKAGSDPVRVLLVADNDSPLFEVASTQLAGRVPAGVQLERLYLSEWHDLEAARDHLIDRLNQGVEYLSYFGHGGLDRVASEGLLMLGDEELLHAADEAHVLAAFSCSIGRFEIPGFVSLGEALVLDGDGSAAAVWAPAGLSENPKAQTLADAFFRALFNPSHERLGDAVLAALTEYGGRRGADFMVEIYNILGDPAMTLEKAQ